MHSLTEGLRKLSVVRMVVNMWSNGAVQVPGSSGKAHKADSGREGGEGASIPARVCGPHPATSSALHCQPHAWAQGGQHPSLCIPSV